MRAALCSLLLWTTYLLLATSEVKSETGVEGCGVDPLLGAGFFLRLQLGE